MVQSEKSPDTDPPALTEAPKFHAFRRFFGDGQASVLAQASAVGISFAVSIVLGLAAGLWLDKKLGTAPWLLLLCLLVGIAAGFKNLFTVSARLEKLGRKTKKQ